MRYADHAYVHAQSKDNGMRAEVLDAKAKASGYSNAADYIHDVQGRDDTRWFEASNNRTCWLNEKESLYGWNNKDHPEASTVLPARNATEQFDKQKDIDITRRGADKIDIHERTEGLSEQDRQAPDRALSDESALAQPDTMPRAADDMTARATRLASYTQDAEKDAAANRLAETRREDAKKDDTKERSR